MFNLKINVKGKIFSLILVSFISFNNYCVQGAEQIKENSAELQGMELFKQPGLIHLTVEETIPQNCQERQKAIDLIKSTKLTPVSKSAEDKGATDVGFAFPTTSPWCLLAAKFIKAQDFRPYVGDWGCGNGFFSRHSLISGGNPYAIDSGKGAATETNKTIWSVRTFLPKGLKAQELYKAFHGSVQSPHTTFMNRQNHINVAFNVIHYLSPTGADSFLKNLYENTLEKGIVILSADTPLDPNNICSPYYNARVEEGCKYPGYGVYNISSIIYHDQSNKKLTLLRSVFAISNEDEKLQKFKMGEMYKGIYPLNGSWDNGSTITIIEQSDKDILGFMGRPYSYSSGHYTSNKFDYKGLKNVLELSGFTVLNGWYGDHDKSTLYPHDDVENLAKIRKSKVIIVAQKL